MAQFCCVCALTVGIAQRTFIGDTDDRVYHRKCLRCEICGAVGKIQLPRVHEALCPSCSSQTCRTKPAGPSRKTIDQAEAAVGPSIGGQKPTNSLPTKPPSANIPKPSPSTSPSTNIPKPSPPKNLSQTKYGWHHFATRLRQVHAVQTLQDLQQLNDELLNEVVEGTDFSSEEKVALLMIARPPTTSDAFRAWCKEKIGNESVAELLCSKGCGSFQALQQLPSNTDWGALAKSVQMKVGERQNFERAVSDLRSSSTTASIVAPSLNQLSKSGDLASPSKVLASVSPSETLVSVLPSETLISASPSEALISASPSEALISASPSKTLISTSPSGARPSLSASNLQSASNPVTPNTVNKNGLELKVLGNGPLWARCYTIDALPPCLERSMELLILYAEEKGAGKLAYITNFFSPQDTEFDFFRRITAELKFQLEERDGNLQLVQALQLMQASTPTDAWKDLVPVLIVTLRDVRPLNLALMVGLIDKTENAARQLAGQDVVILIGGTGAGKSTAIHFLAGSKMVQTKLDGMSHIQAVTSDPELEEIITSNLTVSQTRYVKSVGVKFDAEDGKQQTLCLCDAPGFGDTAGAEVDIANGIGIVRALHQCKSVKVMVLLSQKGIGDRWEGVSRVATTLSRFVNDDQSVASFCYVFTKFSKGEAETIRASLTAKLRNLQPDELANTGFIRLLRDMQSANQRFQILDPLNDDRHEFLRVLSKIPAITNPKDVFQEFLSPDTLAILNDQLSKDLLLINKGLQQDKLNIDLLENKLRQIGVLTRTVKLGRAEIDFETCLMEVAKSITNLVRLMDERWANLVQDQNSNFDNDLNSFLHLCRRAIGMEPIRHSHVPKASKDLQLLTQELLISAQGQLLERVKRLELPGLEDVIGDYARRVMAISLRCREQFGIDSALSKATDESIAQVNDILTNKAMTLVQKAKAAAALNLLDYNTFAVSMDSLRRATKSWPQMADVDAQYQLASNIMLRVLQQKLDVKFECTNLDSAQAVVDSLETTSAALACEGLNSHLDLEKIKNLQHKLHDSVCLAMDFEFQQLIPKLKDIGILPRVSDGLKCAETLAKFHSLSSGTAPIMKKFNAALVAVLEEARGSSQGALTAVLSARERFTPKVSLTESLKFLKAAEDLKLFPFESPFPTLIGEMVSRSEGLVAQVQGWKCKGDRADFASVSLSYFKLCLLNEACDAVGQSIVQPQVFSSYLTTVHTELVSIMDGFGLPADSAWGNSLDFLTICEMYSVQDLAFKKTLGKVLPTIKFELDQAMKTFSKSLETVQEQLCQSPNPDPNKCHFAAGTASNSFERITQLCQLLNQPSEIRPHFVELNYFRDTVCDPAQGVLVQLIHKLNALMEKLQLTKLKFCLEVLPKLKPYDKYLKEDRFESVMIKMENYLKSATNDIATLISVSKTHLDFERLASLLKDLRDNKDKKILKNVTAEIWDYVKNEIETTVARAAKAAKSSNLELMREVFEKLQKLGKVSVLKEYFPEFKKSSTKLEAQQSNIIKEALSYVHQSLKQSLVKSDFSAAEQVLANAETLEAFVNSSTLLQSRQVWDKQVTFALDSVLTPFVAHECSVIITNDVDVTKHHIKSDCIFIRQKPPSSESSRELGNVFYVHQSIGLKVRLRVEPQKVDSVLCSFSKKFQKPTTINPDEVSQLRDVGCIPVRLNFNSLTQDPSPKQIYANLISVKDKGERYQKRAEDMKRFFEEQYKCYLDILQLCEPNLARHQISKIIALQSSLPLFEFLNKGLGSVSNDMASIEAQWKQDVEYAVKQDLENAIENMQNAFFNWYCFRARQYKLICDNMIRARLLEFQNNLANGELQVVIRACPARQSWLGYTATLARLRSWYPVLSRDYSDLVSGSCDQLIDSLARGLLQSLCKLPSDTKKLSKNVDLVNHFEHFQALLQIKLQEPKYFGDLTTNTMALRDKPETVFTGCFSWFTDLHKQYNQAADERNIETLGKVLDTLDAAERLLVKFKEICDHPPFKAHLEDLLKRQAFTSSFDAIPSYWKVRKEFSAWILRLREAVNMSLTDNKSLKTNNSVDRDDYFRQLTQDFRPLQLQAIALVRRHLEGIDDSLETASIQVLESELAKLNKKCAERLVTLEEVPTENVKAACEEFNIAYDTLRACHDHFDVSRVSAVATKFLQDLDHDFAHLLSVTKNKFVGDIPERVSALVRLKLFAVYLPPFKLRTDGALNDLLSSMTKEYGGKEKIAKIGRGLDQEKVVGDKFKAIGQMLIADHTAFQGVSTSLRNEKTMSIRIEHVLEEKGGIEGDRLNRQMLREQFDLFDKEYWALVEKALSRPSEIQKAREELLSCAQSIAQDNGQPLVTARKLMVHAFAYWTLIQSDHYITALGSLHEQGAAKLYLRQPHAAQVVSIFRLLGFDTEEDGVEGPSSPEIDKHLENHLVQIKTGEGKSVTLGVTAIVLALLGYDVDCACYSEYLSTRDLREFADLFSAFQVKSFIKYGTFNKLFEDLINRNGDVRKLLTISMNDPRGTGPATTARLSDRPRILLIDEVDVFFSKDFYGNLYRPIASISDPVVTALVRFVWENRRPKKRLPFSVVAKSSEFLALQKRFPDWTGVLTETVKRMLADIESFESHDYVVHNGRIAYKDQDRLAFDIQFGYKTLFAYFKEAEAGKIPKTTLEAKIALQIDCGNFSYAEIPKQYQFVMGVTGTLKTLSDPERTLLNEYNLRKHTYTPSIYSSNTLAFHGDDREDVRVENAGSYFAVILEQILIRQKVKGQEHVRAVLVFFESTKKLHEFRNSREMDSYKEVVYCLTEETSTIDKESLIRQVATKGTITLLSREFGRGTDFVCYDSELNENGGPHVIQTFLSETLSEETQIIGRTARQGGNGSFSMILKDMDLEKFGITEDTVQKMKATKELYTTLTKKRSEYFKRTYPTTIDYVEQIAKDHKMAEEFLQNLWDQDTSKVIEFILERNKCFSSEKGPSSRTIVLMDGTGSMGSLMEKAKAAVAHMFEGAHVILDDYNITSVFEIQFVVYRNYDCDSQSLLQISPWDSEPDNLRRFMDSTRAHGGTWREEAIEVALQHANREASSQQNGDVPITQIILIGDAPPNTLSQVKAGRAKRGESYWSRTQQSEQTNFERELNFLKEKKIPVHAMWVEQCAEKAFQQAATMTNGECVALDINSEAGAKLLTTLVTKRILNDVGGGGKKGQELVDAYQARFPKGYIRED